MNLDYKICNILTKKEVYLREKLDKSKGWRWTESTIGYDIDIKNNEEQYRSDPKNEIFKYRQSIGHRYLDLEEPYKFAVSKSVTLPIISQMKKGGFYKCLDAPLLGQYSTTLFLWNQMNMRGRTSFIYWWIYKESKTFCWKSNNL